MFSPESPLIIFCIVFLGLWPTLFGHTILEEYHCKDKNVDYGMSLRGGRAAGIYTDLKKAKNIQECTMRCCDKKNCDVAMLEQGNCLGIKCFNDSSCETVPATDGENDLQIAHVTGRGLGNLKIDKKTRRLKTSDLEAKCPHNEVMYNMKLAGGLQAGQFVDIGHVKSIMTCSRYCCDDKMNCDLAYMLGKRCYLVKCFSEEKCSPLPASSADYNFEQKMMFVSPWKFTEKAKIATVPSGLQQHHMQCTQSKVYERSKLLGGNEAGRYTHIGKVGKMHICSRLCCEQHECDLAYMFGKDCFLVKCFSEHGCRVIPDENLKKSNSDSFDKQVQFIVKRKYDVHVANDGSIIEKRDTCKLDGSIKNNTILARGMLSGVLKTQHGIEKIDHCVDRCCKENNCHVALMLGRSCYSMQCSDAAACKSKPAPATIKNQNPVVAYVKRRDISMAPH